MNEDRKMLAGQAEQLEDQAAEWLWRQAADWSKQDQSAFDAWLTQSAYHRAAYWRLKAAWSRTERLAALKPSVFYRASSKASTKRWPVLRYAAVACVAAVFLSAVTYLWPGSEATYATKVGDQAKITLNDGSRIHLNTDTEISVSMDARHRTVTLKKGEAFFQVHHNSARPFSVLAAGHRITDLGTEFGVRTQGNSLEVRLVEGRAHLEAEGDWVQRHATDLTPGEVVIATANSLSVSKVPPHQLADALAWRQGKLVFSHVTLANAVDQFNRYNRTKLVVGPEIAALKISGTFEAGSIDAFTSMAKFALGLRAEKREGEIFISRRTQ